MRTRVPSTQPSAEGLQQIKSESEPMPVSLGDFDTQTGMQKATIARPGHSAHKDSTHNPSLVGDDDEALRDVEKGEEKPTELPPPKDPNLIEWDGPDDPENPMNWSVSKKWTVTITFAFMTFVITFASSVFSTATQVTAELFEVSNEVMILGTSLFVLVRSVSSQQETRES